MKKKRYYLYAFLAFAATMAMMTLLPVLLSVVGSVIAVVMNGEAGAERFYYFLMEYINFYSFMIYLPTAIIFAVWYWYVFLYGRERFPYLKGSTRKLSPVAFVWMVMLTFGLQWVTSLVMILIQLISPSSMAEYNSLVEVSGISSYSVMWAITTLILPPFAEEIIFRGLIFKYLKGAGVPFVVANIIQAVCFGIFHQNIVQGIYAAVLGFFLGYLAQRYDSLLAPMFVHFVYNFAGTWLTDLEMKILPNWVSVIQLLLGIPFIAISVIMIQFGIGEKKKKNMEGETVG